MEMKSAKEMMKETMPEMSKLFEGLKPQGMVQLAAWLLMVMVEDKIVTVRNTIPCITELHIRMCEHLLKEKSLKEMQRELEEMIKNTKGGDVNGK